MRKKFTSIVNGVIFIVLCFLAVWFSLQNKKLRSNVIYQELKLDSQENITQASMISQEYAFFLKLRELAQFCL